MDQRTQGGSSTPPPLPANAPPAERDKEGVGGKRDDEEEKKKREKLRDGVQTEPCGPESGTTDPQQQSPHFSVKETSFSEGNVKLKIGLQAKRMKKPPKILENYVCRPAFRATVRHSGGRGRVNRAVGAGDGSGHTSSPSRGKEVEKSPTVNRGAPPPSGVPATSPLPSIPPPVSTSPVTPVNGSAPAKKVSSGMCKFSKYLRNCQILETLYNRHAVQISLKARNQFTMTERDRQTVKVSHPLSFRKAYCAFIR